MTSHKKPFGGFFLWFLILVLHSRSGNSQDTTTNNTTIGQDAAVAAEITYNCTSEDKIYECEQLDRLCMVVPVVSNDTTQEVCGPCFTTHVPNTTTNDGLACVPIDSLNFTNYLQEYGATYRHDNNSDPSQDNQERQQQLIESANYISLYHYEHPNSTFQLGLTKFSADTNTDYQQRAGYQWYNVSGTPDEIPYYEAPPNQTIPDAIDWVANGAVTSVKNQVRCGGCWSISTAGAIEGAAAVNPQNHGYLQSLSFQQLLSCDTKNNGCDGGSLNPALGYVVSTAFGGLTTYGDYEFTDSDGTTTTECKLDEGDKPLAVEMAEPRAVLDIGNPPFEQRVQIMKSILSIQPVSMTIKSSCTLLSNYKGGILTEDDGCACSNSSCIDHAVLMVGYNDTDPTPYWKIKNSWGTDWGEEGYFRVAQLQQGDYGLFAVLSTAVVPMFATNVTVQVPDTPEVLPKSTMPAWQIVLIVLACLVVVLGVAFVLWKRKKAAAAASSSPMPEDDEKQPAGEEPTMAPVDGSS